MIKINTHYFMMLLITTIGASHEIKSYSSKKDTTTVSQSCNAMIHQIEDNIHALRQNVLNYGTTQATYNAIDRIHEEINSACSKKSCCGRSLTWKLNNVKRLADRQSKSMKKNGRLEHQSNGGLFVAPILTIAAPAAIISSSGDAG